MKAAASEWGLAGSWGGWPQEEEEEEEEEEALDPYCLPRLLPSDPLLCRVHPCLSPTRFLPFAP